MEKILFRLTTLARLIYAVPAPLATPSLQAPQIQSILMIGTATSNFPNIYRDGGGGGTISGRNFIMFADGEYTGANGGIPKGDNSNLVSFISNSIARSNWDGNGITNLQDFGTSEKGPQQQIPYFIDGGENNTVTGIWPNSGITTLCNGTCGVSFPPVVNRTAVLSGKLGAQYMYNTGVQIIVGLDGSPVVSRPVQSLFKNGEPAYGSFGTLVGIDGYLYMYAKISQTDKSNGLKMARAPESSWSDRTQYQYWSGSAWSSQIPVYDDGGIANIFNYSQQGLDSNFYGPGTGELYFSRYHNLYLLFFQSDFGIDANVYLSYSQTMEGGWSTHQVVARISTFPGGFSYSFHAYPNYDPTGKAIPLSWSMFQPPNTLLIQMANVIFA